MPILPRPSVGVERDIPCPSARKSGRPLARQTIAIREAIHELTGEQDQMTVRGVFYALMTRGIVDKSEAGYRQVQRQALLLRREGRLPWQFIADGTRWVRQPGTWDTVEEVLRAAALSYRRNLWRSQGVRIEIWLEKDALASLVADVTYGWGVPLMVSRGQSSETYCYNAAREADEVAQRDGALTLVYMLYDSDRYGRNAAATIEKKLNRHAHYPIACELLAVTDEQIDEWDLPTRPEKQGEGVAVELDAIPPDKLKTLVEDAIVSHVDDVAWAKEQAVEDSEREILKRIAGAVHE